MTKAKPKDKFKPGDSFYIPVTSEHIAGSDPCNKENCMLTRAISAWLVETYGSGKYRVKSTNHGVTFDLHGRRYVAVFDTKTAFRIYNYDQTFRNTKNKEKARATVRPFKSRLMIESGVAITKWPTMDDKTKSYLRTLPKKKPGTYTPKSTGVRRELSL